MKHSKACHLKKLDQFRLSWWSAYVSVCSVDTVAVCIDADSTYAYHLLVSDLHGKKFVIPFDADVEILPKISELAV